MKTRKVRIGMILFISSLFVWGCNRSEKKEVSEPEMVAVAPSPSTQMDPLPSWNDGPNKQAILDFVKRTTQQGVTGYIPAADRIAVFDNDGTLWCEQPMYFEMVYALSTVQSILASKPELAKNPKFHGLTDKAALAKNPVEGIKKALAFLHTDITVEEFSKKAKAWLDTAKHSRFQVRYRELTYLPMVELLQFLHDNQFKTYIVSGGTSAFIRQFSEEEYGIPVEQVIGTLFKVKFEEKDGIFQTVFYPEIFHDDDKEGKPVAIEQFIGKKPVLAFGNSDGDLQMLQWTATNTYPNLCLILHHTDAEHEFAYDSLSQIGTLKKALIESRKEGWVVVDMKKDFKTVFSFQK